jgi:hypothetical protein
MRHLAICVVLLSCALKPRTTNACSCYFPETTEEMLEEADLVVRALVTYGEFMHAHIPNS